jgi:hypothetical protein
MIPVWLLSIEKWTLEILEKKNGEEEVLISPN